jgi:hypothetical protein
LDGRGGYCYHLNGAFALLLASLGYDVRRHLGGVHGPDGPSPESLGNHLVLSVGGLPKPSTREVVLSRSAARLLTGTRLQSKGALTSASATIVENDQLIAITVDGDPTDAGRPLGPAAARPRGSASFVARAPGLNLVPLKRV